MSFNSPRNTVVNEQLFVAYIDIIGFQSAVRFHEFQGGKSEAPIYNFWRNAVFPQRKKLVLNNNIKNFVQFSDCIVFYTKNANDLIEMVSDFYGSCFAWCVPIRGGVGFGNITHSIEPNSQSLGSSIMISGPGLIDAYQAEQRAKGKGMRLFISEGFFTKANQCVPSLIRNSNEVAWWRQAGLDSEKFIEINKKWWTTSSISKWYNDPHLTDTKAIFVQAIDELKKSSQ